MFSSTARSGILWPARITIRMPVVVPGRLEIITEGFRKPGTSECFLHAHFCPHRHQ